MCIGLYTTGKDTLPIGQHIDLSLDVAVDTAKVVPDATVSLYAFILEVHSIEKQLIVHVSTAICSPSCRNGGSCTAPNRCNCPATWTGSYCQTGISFYW